MTTEDANPRPDWHAAEPLALRLDDQLGPLPERVAAAGCPPPGWVEPGVVPSPVGRLYTQAEVDAAVAAERERWRAAAEYAAHQLEQARIWGGTEWHYNPLHPLHYRSALERLRDVLRA